MRVFFPEVGVEVTVQMGPGKLSENILHMLPFSGTVSTWGKEIYFEIPVQRTIEKPRETVEWGDVAYWPQGACLCFFFGPTPASLTPHEIRPASPVEIVGRVMNNLEMLEIIPSGSRVEIYTQ